jgi:hypothetical protein
VVAGGEVSDSWRSPLAIQPLSFRALLKTPNSKFLDKGNMEDADLQDIVHLERVARQPLRSKIVSGNRRSGVLHPPINKRFLESSISTPDIQMLSSPYGGPSGQPFACRYQDIRNRRALTKL